MPIFSLTNKLSTRFHLLTLLHYLLLDTADGPANASSDRMFCAISFRDGTSLHFNSSVDKSDANKPLSKREAGFTSQELRSNCRHRDRTHPWTATLSEMPTTTRLGSVCFPRGILTLDFHPPKPVSNRKSAHRKTHG